jgi:glycyl-tRNA synthetase alpha chain
MVTYQELVRRLNEFWSARGCALLQPWDMEVGAGTSHPMTALKCLGPKPWNVAYSQPSRRPADGRYTLNPMRGARYYQYQVLLKPSPENVVDLYMESLNAIGFDVRRDDVRLVEDDWENPSLGASGVGWEVWLNGTEISQFTFFQQMGGIECDPVCAELTYGPERLVLMLNNQDSFWTDLMWNESLSYTEVDYEQEMQNNVYNFEVADVATLKQLFETFEAESKRVIETPVFWDAEQRILTSRRPEGAPDRDPACPIAQALVYPALELALKCGHAFNVLDARGAVSVTERAHYINRVRARVRACCLAYVSQFEAAAKA